MPQLRFGLMVLALVLAAVFLSHRFLTDTRILPPDDFVEYWAAGRLNALGQNPYDPGLLMPLEVAAGRPLEQAILMWNPPWTLTLAMPLGLLPSRVGQLVWLVVNLVLMLVSVELARRIYWPTLAIWLGWGTALLFLPTWYALLSGQISACLLWGMAGFLWCQRCNRPYWAGACAAFAAVKPHIVLLFWLALALEAIHRRRWAHIVGGLLAGLLATLIPLAANPQVVQQYLELVTEPRSQEVHRPLTSHPNPTLGYFLRLLINPEVFAWQYVPTAIGMIWLLGYWWGHRRNWDWQERLPLVLLVSFVTASYGAWPYDLVVLLLPMVQAVGWLYHKPRITQILTLAAVAALSLLALSHRQAYQFVWAAPALWLGYLWLRPRGTG